MLEIRNISKSFRHTQAVKNLSVDIPAGTFYGLLGPNGAGKTTTIQMISGILSPDSGNISVQGQDVYTYTHAVKMKMGIVPQEIALYDDLSARDNLLFWGGLYHVAGAAARMRADALLEWVGLTDRSKEEVGTYSGGMKRRINIACALMHDPQLILMDEPTVGIDPQSRNKIYELLQQLHAQGKTILYTTHYMEEAERMCDVIGIIDHGSVIAEGSMSQLIQEFGSSEKIIVHYYGDLPVDAQWNGKPHEIHPEEQSIYFSSPHAGKELPEIAALCAKNNIALTGMDIQKSNLETIFLDLTGRQLRD